MSVKYANKHVKCSFVSEGVLLASIARPPVNALNTALWLEIGDACTQAGRDPEVRCIVLASEVEKMFTAGLDLTETLHRDGGDVGRTALVLREHIKLLQDAVSAIQLTSKPVVAAVHGLCLGGGIDIIAAADVRYASDNAVFSIKEVDVGLAADVGSLQRLPKSTASASLLYELALTARNFGAAEAEKLGLVSKVVSGGRQGVLAAAIETAKVIATKSPIAVVGTKEILNYSREHTVQEGLEYTRVWNQAMLQSSDLATAFGAFATKKPPTFEKLSKL